MEASGMLSALPINEFVFFINKGLIAGLIIGSVYALGAVGVTLISGILRFSHFAAWRHDDRWGRSSRSSWPGPAAGRRPPRSGCRPPSC